MEYLPGPSLADLNRQEKRIDLRQAAEIIAQIASGLEAAHRSGLVHSDVKPANILIDQTTGRAKIGDFGLARLAAEVPELSREGLIPGTPAYLNPEQARGESTPDPRSDVYSLGVTLYESLAGEIPFRGLPHRIIHQVLNEDPRPPRIFNDAIPRDLETICLKAIAKDPSKRYQRASAFADDVRCFLRGEPIKARPVGPLERGWRWCRTNRRVATLSALAGVLLVSLAIGSTLSTVWIARERSIAVEQTRLAEARGKLASDAFTSLVVGVQDKLASRPGTLELRRSLLEIARAGLSQVTDIGMSNDQENVADRQITSLIKLGDLDVILGQTAEARVDFGRALGLAEKAI